MKVTIEQLLYRYPQGEFCLRVPRLDLASGSRLALVGPSGCGKSTLLHLLAGIAVAKSGRIALDNCNLADLDDAQRRTLRIQSIGFVFQEFRLLEYLDVWENVRLPYRLNASLVWDQAAEVRCDALLRRAGISALRQRKVGQLSVGERQRVAVCRALVTAPQLILADEPTGNLDNANKRRVFDLLLEEAQRSGASVIAATHDQDFLSAFDPIVDLGLLTTQYQPRPPLTPSAQAVEEAPPPMRQASDGAFPSPSRVPFTKGILPLVFAYMRHHPLKCSILFCCLSLSLYLPFALFGLGRSVQASLMVRAVATPVLVGAVGSQFDLVLHSLYHRMEATGRLPQAVLDTVNRDGIAQAIPLFTAHTAKNHPIVATSLDYFNFRQLVVAQGTLPLRLGDCVLGAVVAEKLGLQVGDRLLSDTDEFFDFAGGYPLNMRIAGILAASNPADDRAVFVDVRTGWLMEGIAHGHDDLAKTDNPELLLGVKEGVYVGSPAVREFTEVTAENLRSFHFHGDPATFPLTAVIAIPRDERAETLVLGRFIDDVSGAMALRPLTIVTELFDRLLPVKRLLGLQNVFLAFIVACLIALVITLSLRLRGNEFKTMERIGCSHGTITRLWLSELLILLIAATVTALIAAGVTISLASHWLRGLIA